MQRYVSQSLEPTLEKEPTLGLPESHIRQASVRLVIINSSALVARESDRNLLRRLVGTVTMRIFDRNQRGEGRRVVVCNSTGPELVNSELFAVDYTNK